MSCSAAVVGLLVQAWLFTPAAVSEGGTPSAKSILDKAIAYHGGLKALDRKLAFVRTEENELTLDGEKIPLTCEWHFQPPDKRGFQAVVKVGSLQLQIRQGLDGDKGWAKVGPALAVDLSPEQVNGLSWEHNNHAKNVLMLPGVERNWAMSAPESTRFADHDAWKITFTNRTRKAAVTVFFDKASGAVLGDEGERVVPHLGANSAHEKPAQFRALFKTYLDVEGIKMPAAMTIFRDGVPIVEVRKVQVRVVDAIDPKIFVKP